MQKNKLSCAREECINALIVSIIGLALYDLFRKPKKPCDAPKNTKYKERWAIEKNRQIEINRQSAKKFFEQSKLFKLTGLNFDKLAKEYQRIKEQQNDRV